jgi:hypothetical protein
MWGFPLPTSQGRIDHSSFTSSPISRPKTQDPRPISDLPGNNKNKIADLFFLMRFFSSEGVDFFLKQRNWRRGGEKKKSKPERKKKTKKTRGQPNNNS